MAFLDPRLRVKDLIAELEAYDPDAHVSVYLEHEGWYRWVVSTCDNIGYEPGELGFLEDEDSDGLMHINLGNSCEPTDL